MARVIEFVGVYEYVLSWMHNCCAIKSNSFAQNVLLVKRLWKWLLTMLCNHCYQFLFADCVISVYPSPTGLLYIIILMIFSVLQWVKIHDFSSVKNDVAYLTCLLFTAWSSMFACSFSITYISCCWLVVFQANTCSLSAVEF